MNGTLLRFYVHEKRLHRHIVLYEWLLEQAKSMGIPGGSVFRAIASYGRHGVLREEHFYELAGDLSLQVDFVVTDEQATRLLALLESEGISVPWVRIPVRFGVTREAR
jgi:PII-like signaling protein